MKKTKHIILWQVIIEEKDLHKRMRTNYNLNN